MPGILESKSDKFHRLAERRASEIISKLRLLANLSDKRNYDYSEEHVKQLFDALESELKLCKARFKAADAAHATNSHSKSKNNDKGGEFICGHWGLLQSV